MILRDPVHGLIAFEGAAERVVRCLLETREVQRLRRVRQLGLTSLVFPGAEHTRFAHAIGAAHVWTRLSERLCARQGGDGVPQDAALDPIRSADALGAALLHDLGHGPFSHLFEDVLPDAQAHERWTEAILLDSSTEVHRALRGIDREMPERVASLICGTHPLKWLTGVISGVLDVDRCDYLLRDSHMTGVAYGRFDLEWLLRALAFARLPDSLGGEWVLAIEGRKGLPPIESFFLARHFMYQQVYHHKATRAAECLVRAMFMRLAELIQDGRAPSSVPTAVSTAILGEPTQLERYLELDDVLLLHAMSEWERDRDVILSDLARRLRARQLWKTIPLRPDQTPSIWKEAHQRVAAIAEARGFRPDLYVHLDIAEDMPFEERHADAHRALWVTLRHQPLVRLGDVSFPLEKLRNQSTVRPRLCFPGEIREEAAGAIEEMLHVEP